MRSKNKIAAILCTAVTAVSFLYPFSDSAVYARQQTAQIREAEETKEQETQTAPGTEKTERAEGPRTEKVSEIKAEQSTEKAETAEEQEEQEPEETQETAEEPEAKAEQSTEKAETAEEQEEQEPEETQETAEEPEAKAEQDTEKPETAEEQEEQEPEETQETEEEPETKAGQDTEEPETAEEEQEQGAEATKCTWTMPEFGEIRNTGIMARTAARSSIGIVASAPGAGQQNRYEYSGGIQTFVVPQDGYYDICCYGSEGGDTYESYNKGKDKVGSVDCIGGGKGNLRSGRALLRKGTVLTIMTAPRGSSKTFVETEDFCKNHDVNWSVAIGNSGEPSYITCDGTTVISASGGTAGYMNVYAHPCNGDFKMDGNDRAGKMALADRRDKVMWQQGQTEASRYGIQGGNGLVTITVVRLLPSLNIKASTNEWTNRSILLSAEMTDGGAVLPGDYLSWETDESGDDIWTEATSYPAAENGTYTCKVRNTDGDIVRASCEITNIDRLVPDIWLRASERGWTNKDVVLEVVGEDQEGTETDGRSGLPDKAFWWGLTDQTGQTTWKETTMTTDGAEKTEQTEGETTEKENWTQERTVTASQNGTYRCRARDRAGNVREVSCRIGNIDRTPPEVTYHKKQDKWYDGRLQIVLEAKDLQPDGTEGCGLDEAAYSTDGIHFQSRPELWIDREGACTVWVRDRLGNVSRTVFEFYHDARDSGEEKQPQDNETGDNSGSHGGKTEALQPVILQPVPIVTEILPQEYTAGTDRSDYNVFEPLTDGVEKREIAMEREAEPLEPETEAEEETESGEKPVRKKGKLPVMQERGPGEPLPEALTDKAPERKEFNWRRTVLYSVWMVAALCGLVWLLFYLLFEHVTVYRRDDSGKYCRIGRCAIIRKKDYKQIHLNRLMKKEERRDYKIRFTGAFAFWYRKEKVLIRTYHGVELRNVEKEIEILACN